MGAANEARGLAMDSIAAAHSGHMGLPLGAAEIGAVLFGSQMSYNAADPTWINRDRFILSAGHGSMFIYSWLHLAGYDLPLEEVKNFRQHHSMTPGHPEFPNSEHTTPGIECTTGPLGAGVSNAVGFAVSEKMAAARYNTEDHTIFDHHIFALAGDGCFQEGVSAESATFAAHEKLDNLIVLYDSNEVTLDKMAEYTQSEDIMKRYDAYGWETYEIDGHDLAVVEETIAAAKASKNGKPKFIKCNTILNGIAYHGIFKASGSTFLVFVDYFRPTIRVASLAELGRVSYILTHDSIGVGEDGPTHQPVETVSGLRVIPNLDVFRPSDAEETVAAYVSSVTRSEGPTALILSRQNLGQNTAVPAMERRAGALKGAYVAKKETDDLDLIIIATGSEVQHALEAAAAMPGARVVSMPCMELYERQSDDYKESVLPSTCTKRIAMEAGVSAPWYKYASKVVGVDRFGFSAPGDIVMEELGMSADNLSSEIATMN